MSAQIVVTPEHIQLAKSFALKSVSSSIDQYARRHQTDPRQIQHQIEIGKIGEFAAYQWLSNLGLFVSTPDTELYDARHKTFTPDMFIFEDGTGQIPIHVKAQDTQSAQRFGKSWTFQYSTVSGSDKEIFAPDPQGYVVFVLIDNRHVEICAAPLVRTLHDYNLFRDPKLAKLRGIKTVVYYEDLDRLDNTIKWALSPTQ